MKLCTTLENLDNIPDGDTRKIINYTAGSGISITDGVISATGGGGSVDIDNDTITKNSNDELQTVGVIDQKTTTSDKFWTGTLEEYNAITTKDDNTFYHITDDDVVNDILYSKNKVLWTGAWYMHASQSAALSEKVSEQEHGIVLVWQPYEDGAVGKSDVNYKFIPKYHTQVLDGIGVSCILCNSTGNYFATKYVYVYDDKINGNAVNTNGATARSSGLTTTNNLWVLTYVLGV